jgi:hypothetical protein
MGLPGQNLGRDLRFRLAWHPSPPTETIATEPDLGAYRAAVSELSTEVANGAALQNRYRAEAIVTERINAPELLAVLSETPNGATDAVRTLLSEVRNYRPNARSSAMDLAALIRIYLLSRIEIMWWRGTPEYLTNAELLESGELVDLEELRRRDRLRFRYRRQAQSVVVRAARALDRRLFPDRIPRTAGLRFTRTRPECVALANQLSVEFARRSPEGMPPLWVTSLTRSVQHQLHLRELGYAAVRPSAHCLGYAIDIEMSWFRRYGGDHALAALLLERQGAGDVNVIDEGQAWHVCVSPAAAGRLRRDFDEAMGS